MNSYSLYQKHKSSSPRRIAPNSTTSLTPTQQNTQTIEFLREIWFPSNCWVTHYFENNAYIPKEHLGSMVMECVRMFSQVDL